MQRGDDLAEGDAAVVGRNALVPIGAETLFLQALDGALGQVTVLEAAAGQDDARLADPPGNGNDGLGQRIVEPGGDLADGNGRVSGRQGWLRPWGTSRGEVGRGA